MSSLAALRKEAEQLLTRVGIANPVLDARLLLEAATGFSRTDLLMKAREPVAAEAAAVYQHLIERRAQREPVARILGQREFWGLPFKLGPGTLEPRPDSETLIEAALEYASSPESILDLGTGTGCLLAALLHEYPAAQGVAVDANPAALEVAADNFAALELTSRVTCIHSSWWAGVMGTFDLIISNPPYLTHSEVDEAQPEVRLFDPALALDGGEDGLAAYREILARAASFLKPQGILILELGAGQGPAVSALATQNGLKVNEIKADLGGIPRALVAQQA